MSVTLSETRDRVASMLAKFVGRVELSADGDLSFPYESTRVFVGVRPWAENSAVVSVFAVTNVDLTPSPELYEFVALHTGDWVFGHLGLSVEDGKALVYFSHALLGDFLDEEELQTAVGAVAIAADEIDDKVKTQFGGRLPTEDVAP
jgi:hypothetical protein